MTNCLRLTDCAIILLATAGIAAAQYEISWSTVDGGGSMNIAGGPYELAGTIGQPDTQAPPVMNGGGFELTGGFWPVSLVCYCPGDLNGDGKRDGADVQNFAVCLIAGGNCMCADIDVVNGVTLADVSGFVSNLLATIPCP